MKSLGLNIATSAGPNRRIVVAAILLVAAIIAVLIATPRHPQRNEADIGSFLQQQGAMTEASYNNLHAVDSQVLNTGRISDKNIAWLSRFIHTGPSEGNAKARGLFMFWCLKTMADVTDVAPSQRPSLLELETPFTRDPSPDVRGLAAVALCKTKDPLALPILRGMEQDPNQTVRIDASAAINILSQKLNEHVPNNI